MNNIEKLKVRTAIVLLMSMSDSDKKKIFQECIYQSSNKFLEDISWSIMFSPPNKNNK